jgi:hypothetical protein
MTATNKQHSYPRVVAIQIYVHPRGENPINTPHASMLDPRWVPDNIAHMVHIGNLLLVPMRSKHAPTPREVLVTKTKLARSSPWVTSFILPHDSLGVGERGFGQVVTQLHRLTRPIYQHAIKTFSTCSRGPTHRSLTDIGRGYKLEGAGFSHHTPRPFQLMVSTFDLRAPPGLRLSIQHYQLD